MWDPAGAHPHCRVRIFPADTLSFCLILFSHRSSISKLHIINMPFCSALFLKTAIKVAEIFEHLIILSRGLAPSSPLSFCKSFPRFFLRPAENIVFSKLFVDTTRFLWQPIPTIYSNSTFWLPYWKQGSRLPLQRRERPSAPSRSG